MLPRRATRSPADGSLGQAVNRISRIRRTLLLVSAAAILAAAGCRGGQSAAVTVTHPLPSHASPQGAAVGFFTGLVNKDQNACTFAATGATPICLLALQSTKSTFANLGIGRVTVRGNEALVTVVGTFCVTLSATNCTTNTNPKIGQPASGGQKAFDTLYKAAVHGHPINRGAVPCERNGSEWYVSLSAS